MNTQTDPVDAEIDDQIFGGCFSVLIIIGASIAGIISSSYLIIRTI